MHPITPFPATRLRRLRRSEGLRAMVRENTLTPDDFIWPVFVRDGDGIEEPVASMPGVVRRSVDKVVAAAREAHALGIPAICLFPYTNPALKTEDCAEAWSPENLSNRATRAIKDAVPDIMVMTDVALDPYNITGHDGYMDEDGYIVNDRTVEALVRQTLSQARAGSDIIGPSDMMDSRIAAMRGALRAKASRMSPSSATRPNTPVPFMARSAMRWARPAPSRVTRRATRWTPAIPTRRCVWWRAICPKVPTW